MGIEWTARQREYAFAAADDGWAKGTNFSAFTDFIILLLCSFACHQLNKLMLLTIAGLYEIVDRSLVSADH